MRMTDEGIEADKKLDAIMEHLYQNDPVKVAQWTTARHVRLRAYRNTGGFMTPEPRPATRPGTASPAIAIEG